MNYELKWYVAKSLYMHIENDKNNFLSFVKKENSKYTKE